jgi:hypothetical protein
MLKRKPPSHSLSAPASSPAVNVLDRVIAIAPAPLLPGEKERDYAATARRIVGVSGPQDAIEEILVRDVIDLSGKSYVFGVSRRES